MISVNTWKARYAWLWKTFKKNKLILCFDFYWFCTYFGNCLWHCYCRNHYSRPQIALTLKRHCCVKWEDSCAVGMWGFTLIETRLKVDCPWNCLILTWLPAVMAPLSVITPDPHPTPNTSTHMHIHTICIYYFFSGKCDWSNIHTCKHSLGKNTVSTVLAQNSSACCLFIGCSTIPHKFNPCRLLISSSLAWNSSQYKKMV